MEKLAITFLTMVLGAMAFCVLVVLSKIDTTHGIGKRLIMAGPRFKIESHESDGRPFFRVRYRPWWLPHWGYIDNKGGLLWDTRYTMPTFYLQEKAEEAIDTFLKKNSPTLKSVIRVDVVDREKLPK